MDHLILFEGTPSTVVSVPVAGVVHFSLFPLQCRCTTEHVCMRITQNMIGISKTDTLRVYTFLNNNVLNLQPIINLTRARQTTGIKSISA